MFVRKPETKKSGLRYLALMNARGGFGRLEIDIPLYERIKRTLKL